MLELLRLRILRLPEPLLVGPLVPPLGPLLVGPWGPPLLGPLCPPRVGLPGPPPVGLPGPPPVGLPGPPLVGFPGPPPVGLPGPPLVGLPEPPLVWLIRTTLKKLNLSLIWMGSLCQFLLVCRIFAQNIFYILGQSLTKSDQTYVWDSLLNDCSRFAHGCVTVWSQVVSSCRKYRLLNHPLIKLFF